MIPIIPFARIGVSGYISGELMRPESEIVNEPPTVNQSLDCDDYNTAMAVFAKEKERLNVKTPCQYDPPRWDGVDFEEGEKTLTQELARVEDAVAQCTYCPLWTECMEVALAISDGDELIVRGVVAGFWEDDTKYGEAITYHLRYGEWPEDVDERKL